MPEDWQVTVQTPDGDLRDVEDVLCVNGSERVQVLGRGCPGGTTETVRRKHVEINCD